MRLTPLDIKKQEFKNTFRGYDPLEVDTFLEMVADEYEELQNERNQLTNEILTLRTQLKDYQQVEHTLKQTLMNAQESVNRARVNTEKEANLIIHEAELKAEKILERARRDLEKMKNELIIVRSQKESFAKRLKHLLESQIELIKVLEIDDTDSGIEDMNILPETALKSRQPESTPKTTFTESGQMEQKLKINTEKSPGEAPQFRQPAADTSQPKNNVAERIQTETVQPEKKQEQAISNSPSAPLERNREPAKPASPDEDQMVF